MKLDESVIEVLLDLIDPETMIQYIEARDKLRKLDLVFKPGDSSQSLLVENKK